MIDIFLWSILVRLHTCENSHSTKVRNYIQYFIELNIDGFDFTNGFKCSAVHKFEKLNKLFIKVFELNFYQDQNKWKQNLIPYEISSKKDESDRVVHLRILKKSLCSN